MRKIVFDKDSLQTFVEWEAINRKIFVRIAKLIEECRRTPFAGTGKPEPLKGNLKGKWSRRIDDEHRLVYTVTDNEIIVHSIWGHYE
ncbi:Txe/YoeB family addiction module toxin [Emticicia sp. W12TSBA100-4]|uniref:Txe/YoeB family addiction module toxin n=1 Tax=Emticicia sp. W12TSBA100-4 TaxID=3160965 RepID=UPI0033058B96